MIDSHFFLSCLAAAVAALVVATGLPVSEQANPAAADDLKKIVADGATVEKVAGGFQFTEGPVYDRKTDSLIFSDIPADSLFRYTPATGKTDLFRKPSGQANGNTLDREGRLISCEHQNRRVSRTEKEGMVVTLAYAQEFKRLNSPNDIVVKSDGTLYFTDPPYGIRKEQEEIGYYGVYRIGANGTLTLLVRDFLRPNGLAFSPDEKRLYVADTEGKHIRVFEVRADGTLANGRVFADLTMPEKRGAPDGLKVDVKGNVYCTGPSGVWVIAPDGKRLGIIEVPEVAANVGFGDKDFKSLYITASTGLYRIRLKNAGVVRPRAAK